MVALKVLVEMSTVWLQPAGGPELPLRTSEVLGEREEAETKDRAGQASGMGDGQVGGHHPPVYLYLRLFVFVFVDHHLSTLLWLTSQVREAAGWLGEAVQLIATLSPGRKPRSVTWLELVLLRQSTWL